MIIAYIASHGSDVVRDGIGITAVEHTKEAALASLQEQVAELFENCEAKWNLAAGIVEVDGEDYYIHFAEHQPKELETHHHVVHCYDCRQGEIFVVGPFPDATSAFKWASDDAESKATEWDMRSGLDADTEGCIVILDDNQENVYEWEVRELIKPV